MIFEKDPIPPPSPWPYPGFFFIIFFFWGGGQPGNTLKMFIQLHPPTSILNLFLNIVERGKFWMTLELSIDTVSVFTIVSVLSNRFLFLFFRKSDQKGETGYLFLTDLFLYQFCSSLFFVCILLFCYSVKQKQYRHLVGIIVILLLTTTNNSPRNQAT
jgi:hypothetical protein